MKTFQQLLRELNACKDARIWARGKTIEQVVEKCHRGDWLLWLAKKVDIGLQSLILANGHCVNTVRHLMKDERSIKAVDTAIAFGEGRATRKELDDAADAAAYPVAAAHAAAAAYPAAAAHAAAAGDYAAGAAGAAYAAYAAHAADVFKADADSAFKADDADAAAAYARKQNQKQTADICREHIGQLIIDKVNELLKN